MPLDRWVTQSPLISIAGQSPDFLRVALEKELVEGSTELVDVGVLHRDDRCGMQLLLDAVLAIVGHGLCRTVTGPIAFSALLILSG